MRAHVLDDPENRHRDLLKHTQALARIEQRDVLGGRHDNCSADRYSLRECQLDIARAGRHVDDQVVEITPVRIGK